MRTSKLYPYALWTIVALALAACGGGSSNSGPPPLVTPTLTAPVSGTEHPAAPATFSWTASGDGASYRLVLVEMLPQQTPSGALFTNPVHFQTETTGLSHPVAAGAPALEPGHAYAWRVLALRGAETKASSPAWLRLTVAGESISRDDAISILVHRLIIPATRAQAVTAWLGRTPLPAGAEVWPWDQPASKHVVGATSWFAWIDDDPKAFFEHDTRFVFIDVVSGVVTSVPSEWWPVVDGIPVWMDDEAWGDRDVIVYSERHEEE